MDLISILATVILTTTIGTVIIGVAAYAAFKLRDKRKPKGKKDNKELAGKAGLEPIFLRRYTPPDADGPDATAA
jgi:heme/copper-type cytochrome/quinol oxidase subunit 2